MADVRIDSHNNSLDRSGGSALLKAKGKRFRAALSTLTFDGFSFWEHDPSFSVCTNALRKLSGETQMTKNLLLVIAMIIIVCTVGWSMAVPLPSQEGWETAQLKVLRVFSARDGDAVFREYLVNWKDQEVVVRDPLVKTNYQIGDSMPVLVMKHKYPNGKPGPNLLTFTVAPH
jgi:hypothetical protein